MPQWNKWATQTAKWSRSPGSKNDWGRHSGLSTVLWGYMLGGAWFLAGWFHGWFGVMRTQLSDDGTWTKKSTLRDIWLKK